jgi:hypothetical protein
MKPPFSVDNVGKDDWRKTVNSSCTTKSGTALRGTSLTGFRRGGLPMQNEAAGLGRSNERLYGRITRESRTSYCESKNLDYISITHPFDNVNLNEKNTLVLPASPGSRDYFQISHESGPFEHYISFWLRMVSENPN